MNVKYLVIHHTASNRGANKQLNGVNIFHRDKNWNTDPKGPVVKCKISSLGWYVQYHYFIDIDSKETQTAKEDEIRWHAGNVNDVALGVCLAGHFDQELPLPEQVERLRKRLLDLKKRYPDAEIVPHRKFASYKSCYGKLLKNDYANNLILNNIMTNAQIVKNGQETGFYLPATNQESLKAMAMNFGIDIPTMPDGSVNWVELEKQIKYILVEKK